MPSTGPEIQVACALIWRNEQILLSKRHKDSHLGALGVSWGKFESGEEPTACLSRELKEELGITVRDASFMFQIPWVYEKNWCVCGFMRSSFDGEPRGLEGQDVSWFSAGVPEGASVSEGE